jgi:hypothetical protein
VDDTILDCLGARRELTDCDVELSVDRIVRRPRVDPRWMIMKQIPSSRRKAEHWKHTGVRKALTERVLREERVDRHLGHAWNQSLEAVVNQRRTFL